MAELHQVQVNETNEEENISLEKQAAMQEEAANQRNQSFEADPKEGKETIEEQLKEPKEERPEWLDEKFESPEDLAKAYQELQKKMSSKKAAPKKAPVEEPNPTETTANAIETATQEFSENGELSDATFEALEAAGLPRAFVEQYINGQQAMSAQQAQTIQESIGGQGPSLYQGSTSGDGGIKPFGSTAQVTEAMRDPRYATDPAYREQVEKRMAVSSIF